MPPTAPTIKPITAQDTWPLRHRVLRPHQGIEACDWSNDRNPVSFHLGAFVNEELVGIASFYQEKFRALKGKAPWRLRGMAVDTAHQGRHIGSSLVGSALEQLRERGADIVWCQARLTAERFYAQHGFAPQGEPFEVEGIGRHVVMFRVP